MQVASSRASCSPTSERTPIDPRTPIDDYERIAYELKGIKDRLDLLEAPTGTSLFRTVAQLEGLVNDIQTQLDEYMASRYTNAQIDAMVGDGLTLAEVDQRIYAIVGSILAGNVSIGGALNVSGTVTLPGARGTSLSTAPNRVTAWIAGDGRLGHTA